ncbi:hypothetical protein CDL15_Pgr018478 [Punica granatum]|uniref:non-specific serine/threonine protein kinase n=1 Tax=Punica granatum TaxID=22663 RepID=A0A218WZG9_PUNGR|nr:hypothetical protein CDL15_Pgr018478 [Punica granatum]
MDFVALATISELLLALVFLQVGAGSGEAIGFTFNGFRSVNLDLDGIAEITQNGLLRLTNETKQMMGHAFYPNPVRFKNSNGGSVFSFSTTFVFAITSKDQVGGGHGIAFVVAPQRGLPGALPSTYFGLFNGSNNGNATNHVFAVELDTVRSPEFQDIDDNHVGIDINGLVSAISAPAGYYVDGGVGKFENLTLISGQPMQVWVDYDGMEKRIDVTLAPFKAVKPSTPLLSMSLDLSTVVKENMFVGFSSSTGSFLFSRNYILGWSFQMNGQVQGLELSKLPDLPRLGKKPTSKLLTIGVPVMCLFSVSVLISGLVYYVRTKRKYAEVLEDWELDYGPHRFKYKDLYIATRGFRDQELLGTGGFGTVYRGILPTSKFEIAVKRISHNSRQGIREFVAEIVSIGRLRHRNLVTLLGYCRRKGELLLVYDYMPNGSLDKYLFNQPKVTLSWTQRFRVIKGVASGLLYLHEGWDQVVIHRDIKASNVLLDAELNGRLGDFGLARLYDHGTDPQTTHVVGTLGYLAPEHTRTGRATKATDVFAFGAFLLEVATGRRPIEARGTEDLILVDWVYSCWSKGGAILEARDPNLGDEFVAKEVELVLKLGLVCSHAEPEVRPTMRQVVQYLEGDMPIQHLSSSLDIYSSGFRNKHRVGFDDFVMSYPSSMDKDFSTSSTVADSILSGGR